MTSPATAADLTTAIRSRDRAAINQVAERLLGQHGALGEQWFHVAQVLAGNGEVALALSAAELGAGQCRGSANAMFQLAHINSIVGRQNDALAIASDIKPGQLPAVQLDHFLGICALETGDLELARDAFERVLTAWQGAGPSWLSLAALPPSDDNSLLDRLNAAAPAMNASPPEYCAQWHYAKGTVLDRLERTEEAWAQFAAGAELVRPTQAYDLNADRNEVDALTTEFTGEAIRQFAPAATANTSRPIFVTGIPRSGTTLIEQALAGHSAIAGGGELSFGRVIEREIGGRSLANLQSFAEAHGVDRLAELYLHLADERFGAGQRFVDKWLGTTRTMGVLASVLPEARIIWLRRDPLDCAWSCFRTYFSKRIEWSWSLADIAAHFQAEDRLYAHWRDVLGERLLTVSYEDFVADPKTGIASILAHVGLDFEPGMEAAHRTKRAVTTASVAQVRQPIYQTSVGAAQRYGDHLRPFLEAYGAMASASGG